MPDLVVETRGLRKEFGSKVAVNDLTLTVRQGEVFGFLGPNGAGKTTSIKMLLALVSRTAGEARVLGRPLGDVGARAKVGFLPEHFRFQDWLSAREFLQFHGQMYGVPRKILSARIEQLLARVDLLDTMDRKLRDFSKGMLQRIGLAAKDELGLRRLGGLVLLVDVEPQGSSEAGRQTIGPQPLPVLHRSHVIVLVVGLQAAQEHLPFEKRRAQADRLERVAHGVILAGLDLMKGRQDAVEVGVQGVGQ